MRARRLVLKVFEQVAAHVATIVAAIYLKQGGKSINRTASSFLFVDAVASQAHETRQVSYAASACKVPSPIPANALLNTRKLT